jgi:hypothetical protein
LLLNLEAAVGELVEQGDNGLQKVLIASQRIDNGPFREHSGAKKSMKSDVSVKSGSLSRLLSGHFIFPVANIQKGNTMAFVCRD